MDSLLPPSLRFLIRLHARGFVRRMARKAKGPKGIAMTAIGALLLLLWIGSVFMSQIPHFQSRRRALSMVDPTTIHTIMPVGLLAMSLVTLLGSSSGKGIAFTAAESDFLFPGPYSRRQIILYRLARSWVPVIWGALFFGTGMRAFASSWPATYLSAALILLYIQVFAITAALLFARVEQKISASKFRNVVLGLIIALAAAALYLVPAPTLENAGPPATALNDFIMKIVNSPLMQRAALPFRPFAYAMTAPTLPALLGWAGVCLAVIAATVALTLRLDADFYESASTQAAKLQETLAKRQRGQLPSAPTNSRLRLPASPLFNGAGAVFWRQATTALRNLKLVLFILLLGCFAVAPVLFTKGVRDPRAIASVMGMLLFMITFVGGALFRFDFRADVDRLDTLKALPISPIAMTLGQLATPVLFMATFQIILLSICLLLLPHKAPLILSAAIFIPIFSTLFTAIENLAFLLFPSRGPVTPGDLTATARAALIMATKIASLLTIAALAAGLYFLTKYLTSSHPLALTLAFLTSAAATAALLPAVAHAYTAYDPSAEQTADS